MGLGKTYSTSYLADSNNNTGADGQVLISTAAGINWSDGSDIVGGPYLPLAGGTLTGGLVGTTSNFVGIIRTTLSTDNSYYSTFTNTGNLSIDTYGVGGYMTFSILGSEAMRINTSGNVGIGTTTTNAISGTNPTLTLGGTGISGGLILQKAGTDTARLYENASNMVHQGMSGVGHHFYVNAVTQAMVIDTVGNVGIGTTSPDAPLTVHSSTDPEIRFGYSSTQDHRIQWDSSKVYIHADPENANASSALALYVDGTARLYIPDSGNVGIGTTSPYGRLNVIPSSNPTTPTAANQISIGESSANSQYNLRLGYFLEGGAYKGSIQAISGNTPNTLILNGDGGNVGIGTTSPGTKLTVQSGINTSSATVISLLQTTTGAEKAAAGLGISIQNGGESTNAADLWFTTATGGSLFERMRITADGNVGIGTTAPGAKLDVSGNIRTSTYYNFNGNPSIPTTAGAAIFDQSGVGPTINGLNVTFRTGNTPAERMRITEGGNVGIGTTSPAQKLDVVGKMKISDDIILAQTNGRIDYDNGVSTGALRFWSTNGGAERMRITSAGNVGIGTTSPYTPLEISSTDPVIRLNVKSGVADKSNYEIRGIGASGYEGIQFRAVNDANSVYTSLMMIEQGGNVGIGTDSPSYKLTVSSGTADIGILTASSDSGSYVGFLDNATSTIPKIGAVGNKLILDASQYVGIKRTDPSYALDVSGTIRATGNVIAYSDARVKENVETIPNALDKVKAMRGVNYNKIGEEKREIGVIAQEVLEVLPEVVHQDEQGMYSVAYGNIVGVLVEAIKELTKEVEDLKKQLK